MTSIVRAKEQFVADRAPRWRDLLCDLIRLRSVFEEEHAIVDYVAGRIEALGLTVDRVPHTRDRLSSLPGAQPPFSDVPDRCSLVARVRGAGGGRSLVLNTHLDIVPEGDRGAWTHDPFAADIDEARGLVFGRGAADDKAGVAISLGVLEALVRLPLCPNGDVVFQFVLEDETTGNGSLLCLAAGHTADAAIIVDGTRRDRLVNQHAGQLQFDLALKGRTAPVCVSHTGQNAAELMARLLIWLRDAVHALNDARTPPWTRFPSPFQLSIQQIHSDGAPLVVPERATAACHVTFAPPFTLSAMRDLLRREVAAFESRFGLDHAVSIAWNGFATEPVCSNADALAQTVVETARRLDGREVAVDPSTGTSDLRHFARAGIPCVLYGPGAGENPHRADEQYALADLAEMMTFYLDVIESWCGVAEV